VQIGKSKKVIKRRKSNSDKKGAFGKRSSGFFDLRRLDGSTLNKGSYGYKKIRLLETAKTLLTERSAAIPPLT
jgi:hypothetical protein